jgi:hypothetical protein
VGDALVMRLRLFLGALVTPQLRHQLRSAALSLLQYTHYEGGEYIGIPLERSCLSLSQLKEIEEQLKEQLLHQCPQLPVHSLSLALFTQTVVG